MQCEIAGMAALLVFEGADLLDLSSREWCDCLRRWLSEAGLPAHTIIGRALTFRTGFEYFAESRFTESGWTRSETTALKILEDAKDVPNSEAVRLAPIAEKMFDTLPARKGRWMEVRKSWIDLASASLTAPALRVWSASQMR